MLDGKPVWAYKRTQQAKDGIRISGSNRLLPGPHTLTLEFTYSGKQGEFGKGGVFALFADGTKVGKTTIDATVPFLFSVDETLDVGEDRGTPVLEDYADRIPFKFTGKIARVTIELK